MSFKITPRAPSDTLVPAWASDLARQVLSTDYTSAGETAANAWDSLEPDALGKVWKHSTGAEIEIIGGVNDRRYYWHESVIKNRQAGGSYRLPGTVKAALCEPAGKFDELSPGVVRPVRFTLNTGAGTFVIKGSAWREKHVANTMIALDGDGDPVIFRLDRLSTVGTLKDGTAFVVWSSGLSVVNLDGTETALAVGDVWTRDGAALHVVAQPGQKCHSTPQALPAQPAYHSAASADAAFGTPSTTDANLSVVAQPSAALVMLDSADASTAVDCQISADGGTTWFRVQPLVYYSGAYTTANLDGAGLTYADLYPGRWRGFISHLRPATSYIVQTKQGATVHRATFSTVALQGVDKVTHTLNGWVSGEDQHVVIRPNGVDANHVDLVIGATTTTIARAAGQYVEIAGLKVRDVWRATPDSYTVYRGAVRLEGGVSRIILRDPVVLDVEDSAIRYEGDVDEIRIVRPLVRTFGRPATVKHATYPMWGLNHDTAFGGTGVTRNWVDPAIGRCMLLGANFGPPRRGAGSWGHLDAQVDGPSPPASAAEVQAWLDSADRRGTHPYGPFAIEHHRGVIGPLAIIGGSMWAVPERMYADFVGNDLNLSDSQEKAGHGIGALIEGVHFAYGAHDDIFETDGSTSALFVDCVFVGCQSMDDVDPTKSVWSGSPPEIGPVEVRSCAVLFDDGGFVHGDTIVQASNSFRVFKTQRIGTTVPPDSRALARLLNISCFQGAATQAGIIEPGTWAPEGGKLDQFYGIECRNWLFVPRAWASFLSDKYFVDAPSLFFWGDDNAPGASDSVKPDMPALVSGTLRLDVSDAANISDGHVSGGVYLPGVHDVGRVPTTAARRGAGL